MRKISDLFVLVGTFLFLSCGSGVFLLSQNENSFEAQAGFQDLASSFAFLETPESFFKNHRVLPPFEGCNTHNWYQIPGHLSLFLGRAQTGAPEGKPCEGKGWTLVLGQMNWTTGQISVVRQILSLPFAIHDGKYTVTTAYDPSVIYYNNEFWVAFECHGQGFPGTVGSCMAPLNINGGLDTNRAYLAIQGVSSNPYSPDHFSGSVPKLMSYNGRAYLYWSAVRINKATQQWGPEEAIQTRGIQLTLDEKGRLVPVAFGAEMPADHSFSFVVFGTDAKDLRANTVADSFQILNIGSYFYLIGTVGGSGCIYPLDKVEGCYRITIRRSSSPLGHHVFNHVSVPESQLPLNPNEYFHFLTNAMSGQIEMAGQYLAPIVPKNSIPGGYYLFSIPTTSEFLKPSHPNMDPLLSISQHPVVSVFNSAYKLILQRQADSAGLQSAMAFLGAGRSIQDFLIELYRSNEMQARFRIPSLSSNDFVHFIYPLLFNRNPRVDELNQGLQTVNSGGTGKENLFRSLIASAEFKQKHPFLVQSGVP